MTPIAKQRRRRAEESASRRRASTDSHDERAGTVRRIVEPDVHRLAGRKRLAGELHGRHVRPSRRQERQRNAAPRDRAVAHERGTDAQLVQPRRSRGAAAVAVPPELRAMRASIPSALSERDQRDALRSRNGRLHGDVVPGAVGAAVESNAHVGARAVNARGRCLRIDLHLRRVDGASAVIDRGKDRVGSQGRRTETAARVTVAIQR